MIWPHVPAEPTTARRYPVAGCSQSASSIAMSYVERSATIAVPGVSTNDAAVRVIWTGLGMTDRAVSCTPARIATTAMMLSMRVRLGAVRPSGRPAVRPAVACECRVQALLEFAVERPVLHHGHVLRPQHADEVVLWINPEERRAVTGPAERARR